MDGMVGAEGGWVETVGGVDATTSGGVGALIWFL